jgi:uncharacterized protein (TIGR03437 family)
MGHNKRVLALKIAAVISAVPVLIYAYAEGPPARRTGAPGDQLCTVCHLGTANSGGGSVTVSFPGGLTYTPGAPQQWTVTVTDAQARRSGFELTVRLASNRANGQAGDLAPIDGSTQVKCENDSLKGAAGCPASSPVQFIEHTLEGTAKNTFNFSWTPPASGVGDVVVYLAGNGANGDGTNFGDHIYTNSYTLTPAAPQNLPSIAAQNGVVNGASFQPGIASGAWITIFGTNLASTTRTWRDDEIVGGILPTQLDGVSVMVNNKPAAVYFISPAQLNVQAPSDSSTGPVQVQVTTPQGSGSASALLATFAPGFFMFDPEGRKYLAAVHANGTLLGKPNLFQGLTTAPAAPGETVLLFGTGFGPTDPPVPSGQVFSGAAKLANPVTVRIGGVPADVQFAGLSGAGLYQLNVKIPDTLADGDASVVAEVGGVSTQDNAFITVKR